MIDLQPACRQMIDVLAGVTDDRLAGATPCTEYSVGDLIKHIDQVSRGFVAFARKEPVDRSGAGAQELRFDQGWHEDVMAHVRELGEAWTDPAAWQGTTDAGGTELPNERWGRIALTEMVVHGWDLATAIDRPFALPDETLRACLDHVAEFVPKAPVPSIWGPAVDVPQDAPLLDRILGITGRTPSSTPKEGGATGHRRSLPTSA
ncbi:TIGR03086 family metal-binding protein [Actinomadura fibrosa]|uniref:TIGR03086 family metal-binding protein n=1 Tax=Actinomadura fibrosa TaxID=111802 RepID=A0ABW2XUP9_9ACTN|nr:TIGR03086 family metal-binding protein [Actinomadura fibrosa]